MAEERRYEFRTQGAGFIQRQEFDPLCAPVENFIVEGLTLLCGASKIGKSWFMLDLCCAVASGRDFLGRKTQQGGVLYLALEDSARRIKGRLDSLGECPSDELRLCFEALTIGDGLLDQLRTWIEATHEPRLIVIDTLQKVRGITSSRVNCYEADYGAMSRLKRLADKHHVAIVLVHHLSKAKDTADPYDRVSGSTGLMGAADTTILIDRPRDSNDARLSYVGRDVYGDDMVLRMVNGRWSVVGREVVEREAYERNPIVCTVKYWLPRSMGDTLLVSIDELKDMIGEHTKTCPAGTTTGLSQMLERVAPDLLRYDGITAVRARKGTKRGYRFTHAQAGGANV